MLVGFKENICVAMILMIIKLLI